jgi:hypothetical protein
MMFHQIQRWFPSDRRIVPESDDDGPEVREADDEEEDSVRGTPHHGDDNIE